LGGRARSASLDGLKWPKSSGFSLTNWKKIQNIAAAFILCALLNISCSAFATENTGNLKWCDTVSVTGTLQKSTAIHPFNNSKFPIYTLNFAKPVNIAAATCEVGL
jgi:hypothetical protein